jgi:hypothetical protein
MHDRYKNAGVVCLSVSVDELDRQPAALRFLQSRGATLPNYLLNEDSAVWSDKLKIAGPPCVFVFDQEGREAAKFDNNNPDKPFNYADVEKSVQQLLGAAK